MTSHNENDLGEKAHDYLFEKVWSTRPHRAHQLDEVLDKHEARKNNRRFLGLILAGLAAIAAGITNYKEIILWLLEKSR